MALNGQLDRASLSLVDGWAYLENNTARAWNAACAHMVKLGYPRPTITAPDGAYRDLAGQTYWKRYWTALGKPYNAATPGYSNHGWGKAVDIFKVYLWPRDILRAVFAQYGFTFNVASEPWHCTHNGLTISATAPASGNQIEIEGDDMFSDDHAKILGNIQWLLAERIRPQTDQINGIAVSVGVIQWAVADDASGLRRMVGNLTELVAKLDAGDLNTDELTAALTLALAPTHGPTVAQIATGVQDEQDRRERERLTP